MVGDHSSHSSSGSFERENTDPSFASSPRELGVANAIPPMNRARKDSTFRSIPLKIPPCKSAPLTFQNLPVGSYKFRVRLFDENFRFCRRRVCGYLDAFYTPNGDATKIHWSIRIDVSQMWSVYDDAYASLSQ